MRIFRAVLFVAACFIILASCSKKAYRSQNLPSDYGDILLLGSVTHISLIEKGDEMVRDDSISNVTRCKMDDILLTKTPLAPNDIVFNTAHDTLQELLGMELAAVSNEMIANGKKESVKMPPLIDSLLKDSSPRYGMFTLVTGFMRTSENYEKQTLKGAGVGLLSLGLYMPFPYKYGCVVTTILFDKDVQRVVYYNQVTQPDKNPLHRDDLRNLLAKSLRGFCTVSE